MKRRSTFLFVTIVLVCAAAGGCTGRGIRWAAEVTPYVLDTTVMFEKPGAAVPTLLLKTPTPLETLPAVVVTATRVERAPINEPETVTPAPSPTVGEAAATPAAGIPAAGIPAAGDPLDGYQICTPLADILLEDLTRLISDGYHPPPVFYSDARHPAIDIAFYNWKGIRQIAGTPVQSVLPGRVAAAEVDTFPMGNVVIIETRSEQLPLELRKALEMPAERSLYILYAHMQEDSLRVGPGQDVTACQTIGQVGKTGNTLAAHLHLETRFGPPAVSFDGFQGYLEEATVEEKANYRRWATSGDFRHFDPLKLLLHEPGLTPTPGPLP